MNTLVMFGLALVLGIGAIIAYVVENKDNKQHTASVLMGAASGALLVFTPINLMMSAAEPSYGGRRRR